MKRLIRMIITLGIIFGVLAIFTTLEAHELLEYTAVIWLAFNLIWEVVSNYLLSKKLFHTKNEHDEQYRYARFIDKELTDCREELENEREIALKQAKEIDNYNAMFEQLKLKEQATIKLGDTVTRTHYQKNVIVTAMRRVSQGKDGNGREIFRTEYQLGKNGRFYLGGELRKVNKKWHAPNNDDRA